MYEVKIGLEITKYTNTIAEAFTTAISYYHQGWEVTVINKETRELILSLMDDGYGEGHSGVYVSPKVRV